MTRPILLIAAQESAVLVACKSDRRVATARCTIGHRRDAQLVQAIAKVLPAQHLADVQLIVVSIRVASFSQTRVLLTTANTLSAVIGCPIVRVPMQAHAVEPEQSFAQGLLAARKPHPRWITPRYEGKPNITAPGKAVSQYHITAGGIVYDKNQDAFLFVQRQDSKRIGLPKGHQETGETLLETAKREIAEETGISQLTFIATLDSVTFRFQERAKLHEKKQHNYLFLRTSGQVKKRIRSSEVKNLKNLWLVPERAVHHRAIYPDLVPVIQRAITILQRRGLRPQGGIRKK